MSFFFNKYYRPFEEANAAVSVQSSREDRTRALAAAAAAPGRAAGKLSYPPKVREDVEFVAGTSRTIASARANNAARRFHTMKHDHNWYTYNDIPRPYNPSDFTGLPSLHKVFRG
jgi:hypothetical protein